jgi:hypothetical protein
MDLRFIVPREDRTHTERDHFLTEKMGDCWHEYDLNGPSKTLWFTGHTCKKCGTFFFTNNNFSTMEDFMKLHAWAADQQSLSPVVSQFETRYFTDDEVGFQSRKRFADVLYALLSTIKRRRKHAHQPRA